MIKNWNGKEIQVAFSKKRVVVTAHPYDNLITTGYSPWPASEVVQKLYKSNHEKDFIGEQLDICKSGLGYYCDLQSVNSEDAITWSVFGTVAKCTKPILSKWIEELFCLTGLPGNCTEDVEMFLWRRVPHPDTCGQGGPEIDVGIITEDTVVLCEAKWSSKVCSFQGKNKNKDQLQLRDEFLTKFASVIFPKRNVVSTVLISINNDEAEPRLAGNFKAISWQTICGMKSHPHANEVKQYYTWKYNLSLGR